MSSVLDSMLVERVRTLNLKRHQNQELQSLRAIAVLGVVLFHVDLPFPGGFLGVDVFFVISGYVILASIIRRAEHAHFSITNFFARRYLRLAPALGVCVSSVAILTPLVTPSLANVRSTFETAAASVLGLANVQLLWNQQPYFDSESNLNPLLNMWSLSVEEQFYFALGALIALGVLLRFRSQITLLKVVTWTIVVFSVGLLVFLTAFEPTSNVSEVIFYTPFTRAWQFGLGGLLALTPRITSIATIRRLGLVCGSALIAMAFSLPTTFIGTSVATMGAMLGSVLYVLAASSDGRDIGILSKGILPRIGDYSYSIYLWHWPFVVFFVWTFPEWPAASLVSLMLSLPLSWISYRAIENRFRFRTFSWRYVAIFSVGPLLVIGLMSGVRMLMPSDVDGELRSTSLSISSDRECTESEFLNEKCVWDFVKSDDYVLLVGDSQADSFSDVVAAVAREQNLDLVVSSISGCPYLGPATDQQLSGNCSDRNALVGMELRENPPKLLVIANRASGYLNPWTSNCGEPNLRCSAYQTFNTPTGALATTTEEGVETYSDQLGSLLDIATSLDIPVVLIKTAPHQPSLETTGPSVVQRLAGLFSSGLELEATKQSVEDERSVTEAVEAKLGSKWPEQLIFVDPAEALCSEAACPVTTEGTPLYKDRFHVSPEATSLMKGLFTKAFLRVL